MQLFNPSGISCRIRRLSVLIFALTVFLPETAHAWISTASEMGLDEILYRVGSPIPTGARPYKRGEIRLILDHLREEELSPYETMLVSLIEKQLHTGFNRLSVEGVTGGDIPTLLHDEGVILDRKGVEAVAQFSYNPGHADGFSFFVEPLLKTSGEKYDLHRGELSFEKWNVHLSAGKNRLFWGHGYHTSLMFSDRSEPLPQLQIAAITPFKIPYLPFLGRVRPRLIYSVLDETDRSLPDEENFGFTSRTFGRERPSLWGLRFDLYYTPEIELSLGRVTMFGGDGTTSNYSLSDWLHTMIGSDHAVQEPGGQSSTGKKLINDSNGLMFAEMKIRMPALAGRLGLKGMTAYIDFGADDLRHDLVSSINLPRPAAKFTLVGIRIYPDMKRQLIVEFSEIEDDFFRIYQHSIYTGGHSYKGRWLGHFLGSDSRSYFFRFGNELSILGHTSKISWEVLRGTTQNKRYEAPGDSYVAGEPREMEILWTALELENFITENTSLIWRAQYEKRKNDAWSHTDNNVASFKAGVEIGF